MIFLLDMQGTLHKASDAIEAAEKSYAGNISNFTEELIPRLSEKSISIISQLGSKVHIATRGKLDWTIAVLNHIGIGRYIPKKNIHIFKTKDISEWQDETQKLTSDMNEVYVIGDDYKKDIEPTNKLGCNTIWITDKISNKEQRVCSTIDEAIIYCKSETLKWKFKKTSEYLLDIEGVVKRIIDIFNDGMGNGVWVWKPEDVKDQLNSSHILGLLEDDLGNAYSYFFATIPDKSFKGKYLLWIDACSVRKDFQKYGHFSKGVDKIKKMYAHFTFGYAGGRSQNPVVFRTLDKLSDNIYYPFDELYTVELMSFLKATIENEVRIPSEKEEQGLNIENGIVTNAYWRKKLGDYKVDLNNNKILEYEKKLTKWNFDRCRGDAVVLFKLLEPRINDQFEVSEFDEQHFRNSLGTTDELPPSFDLNRFPNFNRRTNVSFRIELTSDEKKIALRNALRYFPAKLHKELSKEFLTELESYGHIYMYRFCPFRNESEYELKMRAFSINDYLKVCKIKRAATIMLMIQNNLDKRNAQFPLELIIYGSNGAIFQNWIQYRLTMKYLSEMEEDQTLVMYSGHPLGLFPSHNNSPKVVITNGMMVPDFSYSENNDYNKYNAMGVTQYGQMTAGSYMYIGSQGIVHGTTLTLLYAARKKEEIINEARKKEGKKEIEYIPKNYEKLNETLRGKLFVSSGLGGMSGAQPKAAEILGAVAIIAEVKEEAIKIRQNDNWIGTTIIKKGEIRKYKDEIEEKRKNGIAASYAFHGNIVHLWNELGECGLTPDFGSDQTSLHNPYDNGYFPVDFSENNIYSNENFENYRDQLTIEEYETKVKDSVRQQVKSIKQHIDYGMFFFEYGNELLGMIKNDEEIPDETKAKIPSYVKDIMGLKFFDFGFGPFRWVCTSGDERDLKITDSIAEEILKSMYEDENISAEIKQQLFDNMLWVKEAHDNKLVVGSQARILYADAKGRMDIAKKFNSEIRTEINKEGKILAPIVLGRDHHDVSGTDSPNRETNNIGDGSNVTADMSIQNVIGDSFRGATWVSIHNGGGVGWGKAINGGFGMVIQGDEQDEENIESMMFWDVYNGIARRSWSGNENALKSIAIEMKRNDKLIVTPHNKVEDSIINSIIK